MGNPNGNPGIRKKVDPRDFPRIYEMSKQGLSKKNIAIILGFSADTFWKRCKDQPGVGEAYDRGKAEGIRGVSQAAYKMASSGKDAGMTRWWLAVHDNQIVKKDIEVKNTVSWADVVLGDDEDDYEE